MVASERKRRRAVLGIDAAWTSREPSGVALVFEVAPGHWTTVAVAPSYASFLSMGSRAVPPDWSSPVVAGQPDPAALFGTAWRLINPLEEVSITVAVDMPLSRTPIVGRRVADDALARRYGASGCGTHTPSSKRPGQISTDLTSGFARLGVALATGLDALVAAWVGIEYLEGRAEPFGDAEAANWCPRLPETRRGSGLRARARPARA